MKFVDIADLHFDSPFVNLSDKDILGLIDIKQRNEQPTGAFLGAMLDDLLIHLEK